MKNILIITYYWPPTGGVGTQRWLKLSKYLIRNKLKPIIYTPSNPTSPIQDLSTTDDIEKGVEVIKKDIFEPNKFFSIFNSKNMSSHILTKRPTSFWGKVLIWIRANFFVPDSRCLWIKPSVSFLNNYLKKNPVDLVISSGPPHSMHLIALELRKQHNIKWIADFRDPWTNIEYFDLLPLMKKQRKKHIFLEKKVIENADLLLTVSETWANDFKKNGLKKIEVLNNGYDDDDFSARRNHNSYDFKICHFGLYGEKRDHSFFWQVLRNISDENPDFNKKLKLIFAGEVHSNFFLNLESYRFKKKIKYHSHLKHNDVVDYMLDSDVLLVSQADNKSVMGRLPAKLFEYIGARRPILAIGKKDSDLEKIISKISFGWFVDFGNKNLLKQSINEIFSLSKNYEFEDVTSDYSRLNQAKRLIKIINSLCEK